ncbi:hypothetical protein ACHAXA_002894 [Cyclostephanos tholiformis]|uniref:PIH1 domain-containing protein 1 n=1 Tax=Cyclostephanos tholiformis TaxID=382380 RepID=A0ABD3SGE7_9STRA
MERNDDAITEEEARRLENAFGDNEFCKLMAEYATELSDPKYKEEQENYLAQLETRNELPFGKALVWPSSGFVVKCMHLKKRETGWGKIFLNIVYSDRVAGPVAKESEKRRPGGTSWSVPFALGPLRMERDKSGRNLIPTFDCCFHPLSLRYAHARREFFDLIIDIAKDAVENSFGASGDEAKICDGCKVLRGVSYKSGTPRAMMIGLDAHENATMDSRIIMEQTIEPSAQSVVQDITMSGKEDVGIRIPKYKVVERRAFDIAEHTTTSVSIRQKPNQLVITVDLDRATTTTVSAADINLEVRERELKIMPGLKCQYRLEIVLPYKVDPKRGDASFDSKRGTLIVTLPVV